MPMMGTAPVVAEVVGLGELAPGRIAIQLHAPSFVAGLRPGHALHLLRAEAGGYRLRRVAPVTLLDPLRGVVEVGLQPRADGGRDSLVDIRIGERVALTGPIGQPIPKVPRSTQLLVACDGEGFAWVRLLINSAVAEGRSVVLVQSAQTAAELIPAALLPERVEIVVATADGSLGVRGDIADLLPQYVAWADQAVAAGASTLVDAARSAARKHSSGSRTTARGSRSSRREGDAWLSVIVTHEVGCGSGVCDGCTVPTRTGSIRLCREGPAIDVSSFDGGR